MPNAPLIRAMEPEDVPGVAELAGRVPTAPHWPVAEFARMVAVTQETPRRRAAWVACAEGRVVAFAMASHAAGTAELEAVVTAPECRRQGVGMALVAGVLDWCGALEADCLLLEVRASNSAALRLYERMGFRTDGLRRGYYHNPAEDAVLMSRRLGAPQAG